MIDTDSGVHNLIWFGFLTAFFDTKYHTKQDLDIYACVSARLVPIIGPVAQLVRAQS